MVPEPERPPEHVRGAFGLGAFGESDLERLPGSGGWRVGDVVLRKVADRAHALWLARTFSVLEVPGLRIARPVNTTDGRWVIGGWAASRYVAGRPESRADDTVHAAVRLHRATVDLPKPDFLTGRQGIAADAERMAWGELPADIDEAGGGRWFEILAPARKPLAAPDQLVHAELFGTLLFDGDAPPALVDFVPHFRPAEWGAAVAAIDVVAWGGADLSVLQRWSHLPDWSQLLLRATLYRLAYHALHPGAADVETSRLRAAAAQVSELL
ncbi:TIGR02569 family protein [Saccharomonospora sp. CUA-673]|uniref:TIGR02569 family protein n=1 Tax=Saccharomonospora sp. CUA-673 TaxID=1904969 RepID=UPI000961A747|nr:TIGR02569 family protein [Saccharomonospora sp. CUA-673]OLT48193.1 TIGR02569 family protein [Saccharomonospora sp. CUA-673]